ncbi:MAG TPA: hypothetical protein VFI31_06095 [Pirellulales bacterium]|nr:hypothetical protein [Pirellulales bacterium]
MSKPRFSLRWLMGAMSFLAVSFGLLVYARPITGCCAFGVTIFVLFTSIPLSVYRSGERRAFWFGFALFGLGYLVLVCGPWQAPDVHIQVGVRERLPTTKLLELAHTWLPTKPAPPGGGGMGGGGMGGGGMFGQMGMGGMGRLARTRVPTAEWEDFVVIGQSLWAILFAVAGGIIAQRCQRSAA